MENEQKSQHNYAIVWLLVILAGISLTTIHSATDTLNYVILQALWYVVSVVVILIGLQFDAEVLWKSAPFIYVFSLLGLLAVLLFGVTIGGATRWLNFGFMNFQVSEVMKIAYILMISRCVVDHNSSHTLRTIKSDLILFCKIIGLTVLPVVLIMLQPDLGTTIVFLAMAVGIILLSGITWKLLAPLCTSLVGILMFLFYLVLYNREALYRVGFHQYQFDRIDVWMNPYESVTGDAYQVTQSMKAIGSGRISGKGFGGGEVHVPEIHTDFIFVAIGENFGFIGLSLLLMIYFLLIYQLIKMCFFVKSEFYTYIVTGVVMMITFHIFGNIGMTIGLLPVTGIPLPFISYGGSSLLGNIVGIGLVLSMTKHNRSYIFSNRYKKWKFLN